MSTPFQNRLVGTIIVAMAIIIFVPDVLDGEKQSYQADFEEIPKAPEFTGEESVKTFPQHKLAKLPKQKLSDEVALDERADEGITVNVLPKRADFANKKVASSPATTKIATGVASDKKLAATQQGPQKLQQAQAWVIQLGSFRHKNNVKDLLAKLKNNGYTAFTQPIKTQNGSLTKVFIGPELDKSNLEKKLSALKRLTDVQGKLARFTPSKG